MIQDVPVPLPRWYYGGMSATVAAAVTHPLDLIKANLQAQKSQSSIIQLTTQIIQNKGLIGLYNGISGSLLRQVTYSTTRFALYELGKQHIDTTNFLNKLLLAGFSGAAGGFVGTPGDVVNVRMQVDVKLPPENRRNYKHALDGLIRIYKEEGIQRIFSGASTTTVRGLFMNVGQIPIYEQAKQMFITKLSLEDNFKTHLLSSLTAAATATTLTQPIDVVKTVAMNSKPGDFTGVFDIVKYVARMGPLAFFKGYIPAFLRIGPHTIITFLVFEQLTNNFGIKR